ncbi:MAG: hypothetical protein KIH64_010230 [Mycobacterium sp.]|nr:hypothetical protein [Mycobacterium sp.]
MIPRLTRIAAVIAVVATAGVAADRWAPPPRNVIGGPYARLLAAAADLGAARSDHAQITASLRQPSDPVALTAWARSRNLSVRWHGGGRWALLAGRPGGSAPGLRGSV